MPAARTNHRGSTWMGLHLGMPARVFLRTPRRSGEGMEALAQRFETTIAAVPLPALAA